ncbi:MAG: glycosyltransferase family 2 protein [Neisseriaceae bacterium]
MVIKFPVCAVVVTYNRKELLEVCLAALKRQTTSLDRIYIVDNASTDGTVSWLRERGWLNLDSPCEVIRLEKNLGGAGGFHEGIKKAYEEGFEQIWLMDDDGYPADDSLARLLDYCEEGVCLGSLVLDADKPEQLCFPIRLPRQARPINDLEDKRLQAFKVLDGVIIPFNGVLLSRALVNLYGYPRSEYFIWGDDMEYVWRLQANGVRLRTVVEAHFYHPREASLGTPMAFGFARFNDTPSELKLYCMSRNNTANLCHYKGYLAFLFFMSKCLWFYTITQPNRKKLTIALRGIWDGLKRDFSHHQEFL